MEAASAVVNAGQAPARRSRSKKPRPCQDVFAFLRTTAETKAAAWVPGPHIHCNGKGAAVRGRRGLPEAAPDPVSPPRADFRPETSADIPAAHQESYATASSGPVPDLPSDEDIFCWVNSNIAQIKGHARKYLSYSPYEMDEFVQQAYETALQAREDCQRKGAPAGDACFEKVFWSSFRIACIHMTYTSGDKRDAISHEEFQEFGDEDSQATQTPAELLTDGQAVVEAIDVPEVESSDLIDDLSLSQKKALAFKVLELMTPKERWAWELHLKGFTKRETAGYIGSTRQGIQNLLKRGLKRARRLAVPAGLRPPTVRRRPKKSQTKNQAAAQSYLPVIEKSFSERVQA